MRFVWSQKRKLRDCREWERTKAGGGAFDARRKSAAIRYVRPMMEARMCFAILPYAMPPLFRDIVMGEVLMPCPEEIDDRG
jgi:hypothetical protein